MNAAISQMWRRVKPLIARVSPCAAQIFPSWRMYLRCKKRFGPFQRRVKPLLYGESEPVILSGPFKGMAYLNEIGFCGPITPKWIGSYESELHSVIEEVLVHPPELIVDIGSAEGYYAVLLGARLRRTRVVSFDYDLFAVSAQRRLAALHRVSNLEIERVCGHLRLDQLISSCGGRSLIICDIEGEEIDLIAPEKCRSLLRADVLVELHECPGRARDDMIRELTARFLPSHTAAFIPLALRHPEFYEPLCPRLTRENLAWALDEDRSVSCGWLYLRRAA